MRIGTTASIVLRRVLSTSNESVSYEVTSLHRNRIKALYRKALKTSDDWLVFHEYTRPMAAVIRKHFEVGIRECRSAEEAEQRALYAEHVLFHLRHPEPYKPPRAVNGNEWERNLPLSENLIHHGHGEFIEPFEQINAKGEIELVEPMKQLGHH